MHSCTLKDSTNIDDRKKVFVYNIYQNENDVSFIFCFTRNGTTLE